MGFFLRKKRSVTWSCSHQFGLLGKEEHSRCPVQSICSLKTVEKDNDDVVMWLAAKPWCVHHAFRVSYGCFDNSRRFRHIRPVRTAVTGDSEVEGLGEVPHGNPMMSNLSRTVWSMVRQVLARRLQYSIVLLMISNFLSHQFARSPSRGNWLIIELDATVNGVAT